MALENINILQREGIVENVGAETGPYFQKRLRELVDHPLVGEVRGHGMMAAVEIVEDKTRRKSFDSEKNAGKVVRDLAWDRGLLVRATGDSMIMSPPLVVTKADIDGLMTALSGALDAAEPSLRG